MKKSIWMITKGAYSDYEVLGYFPTEKEAKKYCERLNRYDGSYHGSSYERYEYAELEMIGHTTKGIIFYNRHSIWYKKEESGWKFNKRDSSSTVVLEKSDNTFSLREEYFIAEIICPSFSTAKKIAEDRMYQAIAEKEL